MTFGNAFGLSLYSGTGGGPVSGARQRGEDVAARGSKAIPHSFDAATPTPSVGGPAQKPDSPLPSRPAEPLNVPLADIFPADRDEPGFRPIDKSVLALAEPRRIRDPEHLRFVAGQPCLVCGRSTVEAHHLRFAQPAP